MDRRKGWRSNADSVINGLMGLEQLRPRQPLQDNRRALSDRYVHKSATVGLRLGSLVSIQCSHRIKSHSEHSVKDLLGEEALKGDGFDLENSNSLTTSKGARISNPSGGVHPKLSIRATYQHKGALDKSGEGCTQGNVVNFKQKREHDFVGGHLIELHINHMKAFDLQLDVVTKHFFMEPKLENVTNGFKDGKAGIYSKSSCREQNDYLGPGNCYLKPSPDEKLVNEIESLRQNCIGCTGNMDNVSPEVPDRRKFSEMLTRRYMCDKDMVNGHDMRNAYAKHPSLIQLSSSNGSRKQNFGRRERITGVSRIEFSGRGQLHTDMTALEENNSVVVQIEALSNGWNLKQDNSMAKVNKLKQQTIFQIDTSKPKAGEDSDQLQAICGMQLDLKDLDYAQGMQEEMDNGSKHDKFREMELRKKIYKSSDCNLTAQNMNNTTHASSEAFFAEVCSRINNEALSAVNPTILSVHAGHSSGGLSDFSGEASITEFSEESTYSNCSGIGTQNFLENPKRACQHSSNSVLEQCEGLHSSSDRCFDSIGLQFQLDILNLEAEYAHSEGSVMGVCGDDDSEEQLADLSQNGKKINRWLSHDESRNFSYMVDIIDEVGFCGIKSCMDFKTWYSLQCPLNPLVFEALEKKYGEQTSWPQSERRLLFDNINSGLMDILNPVMNFNTSIKGFLYANLRRDEVEDALWTKLIHQQEENHKGSSNRALEKWLEAEEGMNIICTELETSLLDELVGELATTWIKG